MSSLTDPVVSWSEFIRLPERPETGKRYELHDGEVVVAPPARPRHIKLQKRIERLLESLAEERGVIATEFPYRPAPNLQYWVADIAYVPLADWDAMPPDEYPVYAPLLIVEVLSPSNTTVKINRQRMTALSAGAQEFWIVDDEAKTVTVSRLDSAKVYCAGETLPVALLAGVIAVDEIFL